MRKIDTDNFQRATRATSREVNRRILLNLVRDHQPVTRAELARMMGIPRGMVTSLVNQLLAEALIYEGPAVDTPRGRKPTSLYLRAHDRLAVGIDVRASRTSMRLSDFGGREIARDRFATPATPAELIEELERRVSRLIARHPGAGTCEGVGLVVPGMVDPEAGQLLNAPTLGWRDVALRPALEERLGLPVHLERDAVACALAKIWLDDRAGEDLSSFVYVTVSDGLGTGLVVNGEVVRGSRHSAGEFGHIPLSEDGPRCSCGARGCWEAYASDSATLARYRSRDGAAAASRAPRRAAELTVGDLIARARDGDADARAALETTARYLGLGLAAIVNALNPGRIIVGGEIAGAWDLLEPIIAATMRARALTEAAASTPVHAESADGDTRLRGATALVLAPAFAAPQIA
ncbi:MAG TPA: ROK family protein [Longimicrobiales bacterium]